MEILLPELHVDPGSILGPALVSPREYIANPKAVAAQPFATTAAQLALHESGLWQDLSRMFTTQYGAAAVPEVALLPTDGDWIAFPWSLSPRSGCLVWLIDAKGGRFVRHVRLYTARADAIRENAQIALMLGGICG